MKGVKIVREIPKHNKLYADMLSVMVYIKENTPEKKKSEKTDRVKGSDGNEKEIVYSVLDKKGAEHKFTITLEGDKFRLIYVSVGEYPEYIEDDLDFM